MPQFLILFFLWEVAESVFAYVKYCNSQPNCMRLKSEFKF